MPPKCERARFYFVDGDSQLEDVTINENAANWTGGGICLLTDEGTATLELTNTTIEGNRAYTGGGLFIEHSEATADSVSSISSNTVSYSGGGVALGESSTLVGGVISGNTALYGGGVDVTGNDNVISDATITGNSAESGGGVYLGTVLEESTLELRRAIIAGNTARYGGGLTVFWAAVTLDDTTVSTNEATESGGGLALSESGTVSGGTFTGNVAMYGGGIDVGGGENQLFDVTVDGNVASQSGGGLFAVGALELSGSALTNNLATDLGGGLFIFGTEQVVLEQCTVEANDAGNLGGGAYVFSGVLDSESSDWGSGASENTPSDVTVLDAAGIETSYSDYGAAESFTCSASVGTCD